MDIGSQPDDLERLRARLRIMYDDALPKFGKAARFMFRDKQPRETFVTQLLEARGELRRRLFIE